MNMKAITCWMLIVMALTVFLTLGGQTLAAEDDGGAADGGCEILRQVPGTVYLAVEDEGPAEDLKE
jgi:hypothetical protein